MQHVTKRDQTLKICFFFSFYESSFFLVTIQSPLCESIKCESCAEPAYGFCKVWFCILTLEIAAGSVCRIRLWKNGLLSMQIRHTDAWNTCRLTVSVCRTTCWFRMAKLYGLWFETSEINPAFSNSRLDSLKIGESIIFQFLCISTWEVCGTLGCSPSFTALGSTSSAFISIYTN